MEDVRLAILRKLYENPEDLAARASYADLIEETESDTTHAHLIAQGVRGSTILVESCAYLNLGGGAYLITTSAAEFRELRPQLLIVPRSGDRINYLNGYAFTVVVMDKPIKKYPRNPSVLRYFFCRNGFVHTVHTTFATWLKHGRDLCFKHPIQYVTLKDRPFNIHSRVDGDSPIVRAPQLRSGRMMCLSQWKSVPKYSWIQKTPTATKKNHWHETYIKAEDDLSQALIEYATDNMTFSGENQKRWLTRPKGELF